LFAVVVFIIGKVRARGLLRSITILGLLVVVVGIVPASTPPDADYDDVVCCDTDAVDDDTIRNVYSNAVKLHGTSR
jgi:hypothetical protein